MIDRSEAIPRHAETKCSSAATNETALRNFWEPCWPPELGAQSY
jgi:hypothetical protein